MFSEQEKEIEEKEMEEKEIEEEWEKMEEKNKKIRKKFKNFLKEIKNEKNDLHLFINFFKEFIKQLLINLQKYDNYIKNIFFTDNFELDPSDIAYYSFNFLCIFLIFCKNLFLKIIHLVS